MFQEIQNAYEVLSDKHERAWWVQSFRRTVDVTSCQLAPTSTALAVQLQAPPC